MKPTTKNTAKAFFQMSSLGFISLIAPSVLACLAVFWTGRGDIVAYAAAQVMQSGSLLGACAAVIFALWDKRAMVSRPVAAFAVFVILVSLAGGVGRAADEVLGAIYSVPDLSSESCTALSIAGFVSLLLAALALGMLGSNWRHK